MHAMQCNARYLRMALEQLAMVVDAVLVWYFILGQGLAVSGNGFLP